VGFSAAATLRSSYGILKEQGIHLVFMAVGDDVKAELDRFGITELVGCLLRHAPLT
jgi:uroporphyrinogen-III synthase